MTKHNRKTRRWASLQRSLEHLEQRLLLATDIQLSDSLVPYHDIATADSVVPDTRPQEVNLSSLQLLPGDATIGAADGHQIEPEIAQGGNQYLSVWTDYRTSPENHPGTLTEGLGGDIYGIIMDANGNPVSETPIVINQDIGDQEKATAGWNGNHWLVAWATPSLTESPTYQRIVAVRVAPDGTVVDNTPIEVHNDQLDLAYYDGFYPIKIASNGQDWVVAFRNTYGDAGGAYAIRVAADGSIPVATPIKIGTDLPSWFGIAAAQDRYLFTWQDTPGFPGRGRLYTTDLQPIGGSFWLPGAELVASDGTDFMVAWYAHEPGAWYTLKGIKVNHDGTLPNPSGFEIQVMQYRSSFPQLVWDGTYFWSTWYTGSQYATTRIDTAGTVLDPGALAGQQLRIVRGLSGSHRRRHADDLVRWRRRRVLSKGRLHKPCYVRRAGREPRVAFQRRHRHSCTRTLLRVRICSQWPSKAASLEIRGSKCNGWTRHGAALDAEPIEIANGPESGRAWRGL